MKQIKQKSGAVIIPAPSEFKLIKNLKQRVFDLEKQVTELNKKLDNYESSLQYISNYLSSIFPDFNFKK